MCLNLLFRIIFHTDEDLHSVLSQKKKGWQFFSNYCALIHQATFEKTPTIWKYKYELSADYATKKVKRNYPEPGISCQFLIFYLDGTEIQNITSLPA